MKVWSIANQKGGVGKTTTTVSLAGLLQQQGKRVLLVDTDPHSSLTTYLNIDSKRFIASINGTGTHGSSFGRLVSDYICKAVYH